MHHPDFKPKDLQIAWNVQFITVFVPAWMIPLPLKEQPEFPALPKLAKRGLLAPDTWNCKRAQISLKATIDVPMLGTILY